MVGTPSPHVYARELESRGGSPDLLREIRQVDNSCRESNVKPIYTLTHLCIIAKVPLRVAQEIIVHNSRHYKTRTLTKRSGRGKRTIHEPSAPLRALQQVILRNCLPPNRSSQISFAYEPGLGTLDAASAHIGARSMIHLDVQNYFGSFNSKQIYRLFQELGYPELLALEMALIVSVGHEVNMSDTPKGFPYMVKSTGCLPQGAATSGKIANILSAPIDRKLSELAIHRGGTVTRYADDINFSTPKPLQRESQIAIFHSATNILKSQGLVLNSRKTVLVPKGQNFKMLGLSVGRSNVELNKRYKDMIRGHLYGIGKFGLASHAIYSNFKDELVFIDFIWGHFAYCYHVDRIFANEIRKTLEKNGVFRI